jgi:hypothetical protein
MTTISELPTWQFQKHINLRTTFISSFTDAPVTEESRPYCCRTIFSSRTGQSSTVTGCGLHDQDSILNSGKISVFVTTFTLAPGLTQPRTQRVPLILYSRVKRRTCEPDTYRLVPGLRTSAVLPPRPYTLSWMLSEYSTRANLTVFKFQKIRSNAV